MLIMSFLLFAHPAIHNTCYNYSINIPQPNQNTVLQLSNRYRISSAFEGILRQIYADLGRKGTSRPGGECHFDPIGIDICEQCPKLQSIKVTIAFLALKTC